jgi:hypothetical protein
MSTVLDELYVSPRFPQVLADLQAYMAKERARREKFYAELTEDQKAEFVNGEVIVHSPARVRHLRVRHHLHTLLYEYVEVHQLG